MVVIFSIAIKIWATKSVYRLIIECYSLGMVQYWDVVGSEAYMERTQELLAKQL